MNDTIRHTLYAGTLGLCLVLAGCDKGGSPQAASVPLVTTVTIEPETVVLTTQLPGRTASFRVAEIRPQVSGLLEKRLFTEGAAVKEGDVLYQIDPAPFAAEVERAKANLVAAESAVKQAEASLSLAKINQERYGALFEEKAVAASERDQASTDLDVAQATLSSAQAAVGQAQAALLAAEINLGYTKINAPISGKIGRSSVTDGAIVTAYQAQSLATIQQLDPIYVDVPQSTAELLALQRRLANGELNRQDQNPDEVFLIFEDGTRYPLKGKLQFQEVTVDPTTGSVILRMEFPNPDGVLMPGMFVRVEIKEGVNEQAILLTQQGVTRNRKGEAVALVVDDAGVVRQRVIEVGRTVEGRWLVTGGLEPGERVIVEGSQRVRPGAEVEAVAFNPAASPAGNPGEMVATTEASGAAE